jgi:hypothetical protein
VSTTASTAAGISASSGAVRLAVSRADLAKASRRAAMLVSNSRRRFRQALLIASISWRNVGFGKYVPP